MPETQLEWIPCRRKNIMVRRLAKLNSCCICIWTRNFVTRRTQAEERIEKQSDYVEERRSSRPFVSERKLCGFATRSLGGSNSESDGQRTVRKWKFCQLSLNEYSNVAGCRQSFLCNVKDCKYRYNSLLPFRQASRMTEL